MADSLFEGMVLFSPSDILPPSPPVQNQPPTSTPQDQLQPLDEHFFSDRPLQSLPAAQPSNTSRKKKRSSRIGYARGEAPDASEIASALPAESEKDDDAVAIAEERLSLFRSAVSAKHEGIGKAAALAYSERKGLERRRRKAAREVDEAALVYKELERRVEAACEAEDFETAEKVSECLAAAEKERDGLVGALREAEIGCGCFDLRMQELFDLQIAAEEEGVECLENFAKV